MSQASTVPRTRVEESVTPPSGEEPMTSWWREVGVEDEPGPLPPRQPAARRPATRRSGPPSRRSCHTMARWQHLPGRPAQATTVSPLVRDPDAATAWPAACRRGPPRRTWPPRSPDLVGVVLDPARPREVLGDLPVRDVDHPAPLVPARARTPVVPASMEITRPRPGDDTGAGTSPIGTAPPGRRSRATGPPARDRPTNGTFANGRSPGVRPGRLA